MAKGTLQTVDRALQLLEIISEYPQGLCTKELEDLLELNKITVHRLLATLENRGFLERVGSNYIIGLKMVELSSMKLNNIELKTEASPYLRQLVNISKLPVQMAILDQTEAIFIEKIHTVNSLRMYCQIGKRIPLYCSGVGKALLLQEDDENILAILSKITFEKFTPTTLETPKQVLDEIKTARKCGYTIDNEEHEIGIFCIAAPIYDYRGKIIAALSIAGESKAFVEKPTKEFTGLVKQTAMDISARLGYTNMSRHENLSHR
ncbi:IclR family transcriptional regulator [Cellulosilyticum sp. I15G10I2]|uniref:IclR family transcriptional regulator n=1 Tax=Cellulosilyticum sp. I15G10I2 TaxID=1892843 RepID=UPI00085C634B|nr:IclR family transcriptional regulator [Cellulosilyticum sp. I15G10I2]